MNVIAGLRFASALGGILALLGCGEIAPDAAAPAVSAARAHPVAVELFTSQGCSSCPPADAVLERLARDPNVVAMTRAVTYWDRLGWRDTLAREENTQLQRAYSARRGMNRVYTPQAVVQGDAELVGSRETDLRRVVAEATRRPEASLTIGAARDGRSVTLDGRSGGAAVTLVAMRALVSVRIGSGENGGREVRYVNVVVDERPLGRWRGGALRLDIPAAHLRVRGADRYALIVQEDSAGRILAARYL